VRKFVLVGCGGSGGTTLAYIMDQLKSDLAMYGIDKIPAGWQFVHIDVPVGADRTAGLATVEEMGGTYIGTGDVGANFGVVDDGVSHRLVNQAGAEGSKLGEIATWAPRHPAKVGIPISLGAGQFRAIGRMITLSKIQSVRERFANVASKLNLPETTREMNEIAAKVPGFDAFDANFPPITLVISSMAGGAGASMALDICRLLTFIPEIRTDTTGVMLYTPDLWEKFLAPAERGGVRANALAMVGEIIAAQAGVARRHDAELLSAMGVTGAANEQVPFRRVFPVGRYVGAADAGGSPFGETPQDVYRGLGRGLAALMLSSQASKELAEYDLTNQTPAFKRDFVGWGMGDESGGNLLWGSFGFANLSMGRERYREYAAQRLARSAVDRLLRGHIRVQDDTNGEAQAREQLDAFWDKSLQDLQLPPAAIVNDVKAVKSWFGKQAFPIEQAAQQASRVLEGPVTAAVGDPTGITGALWFASIRKNLGQEAPVVERALTDQANQWAYTWQGNFARRVQSLVNREIARLGLVYGEELVKRIAAYVAALQPVLKSLGGEGVNPLGIPSAYEQQTSGIRGTIANGRQHVEQLLGFFATGSRDSLLTYSVRTLARVLDGAGAEFFAPLLSEISTAQAHLRSRVGEGAQHTGLAQVETDIYTAWPSDADTEVASRFDVAHNEVLITPAREFADRFRADVATTLEIEASQGADPYEPAQANVVQRIVAGDWPKGGGDEPPGGVITYTTPWRSAAFAEDPFTKEPVGRSVARFAVESTPATVLGRARAFVSRPDQSFENFSRTSLRSYLADPAASELEKEQRRSDVAAKFQQTLKLARPLVGVGDTVVRMSHNNESPQFRYRFSKIPFKGTATGTELRRIVTTDASIELTTEQRFETALSDNAELTRISVFSSYNVLSPLAFSSIFGPIAQEWDSLPQHGRRLFWQWRRTRPLPASLPMGDVERQALVTGWFVGQIVGRLRLPSNIEQPHEVWEESSSSWVQFPPVWLTAPDTPGFLTMDRLPAVLESILIAYARAHHTPALDSLRPYAALRALTDSRPSDPAENSTIQPSVVKLLAEWLRTGAVAPGGASRVPVDTAAGPAERAASAKSWLAGVGAKASEFLPGGEWGSISPQQRADTPIFYDIADDVKAAARRISDLIDVAAAQVNTVAPGPVQPQQAFETPSASGPIDADI